MYRVFIHKTTTISMTGALLHFPGRFNDVFNFWCFVLKIFTSILRAEDVQAILAQTAW
jgi:hypothetical protein